MQNGSKTLIKREREREREIEERSMSSSGGGGAAAHTHMIKSSLTLVCTNFKRRKVKHMFFHVF